MKKLKVLFGLRYYWPGHERYAATGPVQSFEALTQGLKDDVEFKVIALDQHPGSDEYLLTPDQQGQWVDKGDKQVRYVKGGFGHLGELSDIVKNTDYDLIVLNSFFDYKVTIPILLLKLMGHMPHKQIIVSPRGEFSPGALSIKSAKKKLYLFLNRLLGLTKNSILHATSATEADLFRANKIPCKRIDLAHDTSRYFDRPSRNDQKQSEPLKLVCIARIAAMKNLDGAMDMLRHVQSNVIYDIYGPMEDEEYWERCKQLIAQLPENVSVSYKGPIPNQDVPQTLSQYDLFFMPTRGENFGHVIHEALMSGVPCLISDQTPWRDLEAQKAGYDLPLDHPQAFAFKIDALANMNGEKREKLGDTARIYGEKRWAEQKSIDETLQMYKNALQENSKVR